MSVDWRTIAWEGRRDSTLEYELHGATPLQPETLAWMQANGKQYSANTLAHFRIGEAWLTCYKREMKRRRSLRTSRVITIPAGAVTRCYRFQEPKADRWRMVPTGLHPQWIGNVSGPEVLLVEGEWDCLCAFEYGFVFAATHTAGAGTWLSAWTPMFTKKDIIICYDRDLVGMRGAAKVARALWPVATSVRLADLPLPGSPESKDLSDYFRDGGTSQDFGRLLDGARSYSGGVRSAGRRHHLPLRGHHACGLRG